MCRKHLIIISISIFSILFSICGCKHQVLEVPTHRESQEKNPADYPDEIYPPVKVYASQGTYRRIKISWEPVENAIDYAIYYAETPFDTFTQIAETTNSEYEIEAVPGTNYYFSVVAINYYGTRSTKSMVVLGSSLATPIITEIDNNSTTSFTVHWWMDNCTEDTYQADTQNRQTKFNIYAYDKDRRSLAVKTTDGSTRSVTFDNLTSSTKYWFTVEAQVSFFNEDGSVEDNKNELSDYADIDSAHKVTPDKVQNFKALQGTSTESVLSWNIPQMVWAKEDNVWGLKPVFFSVLRKESGSQNDYTEIATIGSLPGAAVTKNKDNARYQFNCLDSKVYDTKTLTDDKATEIDYIKVTPAAPEDENSKTSYIPNSTITFTDKTASRGVQYDYYVRCFPDFTADAKKYSDSSSVSGTVKGWSICQPTLTVKETYNKTDNTINSIDVSFAESVFDNEGVDYKYLISRVKTEIPSEEETKVYFGNDFKTFTDTYASLPSTAEYYKYNLYILTPETEEPAALPSEFIECFKSKKIVTVINDFNKLPILDSFTVDDGYASKFVIECDAKANVTYDLIVIPYKYGKEESSQTISGITFTNNKYEFTTNVTSGDAYKFMLKATAAGGAYKVVSLPEVYYTLGTPEVSFTTYEYDSITVTWPAVQRAEGDTVVYDVTANYKSSPADPLTYESKDITYDTDKNLYTCKIIKPAGYNNSTISGKPVDLIVTATSSKHNAEKTTSPTTVVRTLGPAEIKTETTAQHKKNQTSVSWTHATGAKKYLVYRIMYGDKDKTESKIIGTDKLIVDAETLIVDCGQENNGRTVCEYDANAEYPFTLTDKQMDAVDTYGYQYNQERIQWGYPIEYVVFPIRSEDTASSVSFKYENGKTIFDDKSVCAYEDSYISNRKVERCTFGYGFNVHAAKSESGSKIVITWEKPNNVNKSVSIYRMPFNKDSNYNYGSSWEKIATKDYNVTKYEDYIDQKIAHLAYVYAIQYDSTSDLVYSYRTSPQALGMKENNYDDRYTKANKQIEPSNKGYLFSITNVEAEPIDGENSYRELISWNSTWDFEERALCPKSFDIQIKNKNLAYTKDWISIARVNISPKGDFTFDKTFKLPDDKKSTYDIYTNTESIGELSVEPDSFRNNASPVETNGLLKVLRDTRHYYSFNITDGRTDNGQLIYDRQFEDESLYTYRNITKSELTKCINVILADALYQAHIDKTDGIVISAEKLPTYCEGKEGTFTFTFTAWEAKSQWGFSGKDYIHVFRCGSPVDETNYLYSDFTLCAENSDSVKGCDQQQLYHLPELKISISHPSNLSSYNCKYNITVGESGTSDKYSLAISINNKSFISISSDYNNFMKWFPYFLKNKTLSSTIITKYNESCPLYMTPKASDSAADKAWKTWWN